MEPIVDPQDAKLLASHAWRCDHRPYFRARIGGKMVSLHRIIAGAIKGQIVDHIDGNPLNCRRSNLRICDPTGSARNRGRKHTSRSPYKGVWQKPSGRWQAIIMDAGKFHNLGVFDTPEDAASAYDIKAVELHGEFARINNIAG